MPTSDGPPARDRETARKKALNHFTASEQRDSQVRVEIARERAAVDAKTAKLRSLRLAKEEADRIAAANAPAAPARKPRVKPRSAG